MNSVVMRSDVDTRGTLLLPYIIVWLIGACSLAAVVIFVNVACSRSAAVERRNAVLAVSLVITILYAMWSAFMIRYVLTPLHDEISEAYAQLCAFFSHVESLELDKAPVYAASSMKHKEEVTYVDEYGALLVVPFSVRPELQDVQAEASLATLKLREYCSYLPHDYVGVDHAASLQPHDGDRDAVDNDHSSLPPLPPPERCRRRRSWRHRHGPTLQRRSATVLAVLSAAPDAAIDDATASAAMNALFDAAARYDGKVTQCSLSGSLVSWNTCRRRQPNHEALGFQCGLQIVESMRRLGTTVVVAGATSDETLSGIMDARDDSHYTVVYGDSVVLAKAAASLAIACNTSAKDMPLRYIWASPNNNNNNNNSSSNFPKQVDYSFVPFASMQTSAFGGPTAVLFSVNPRSSIGAVVDDDAPVLTAMRHAFDLFSNGHYAAASDVYGTAVSAAAAGTDLSKVAKWLCDLSACYAQQQQQQQHGGAASSSGAALVVPPHWQSFGEAPCTRQAHGGECVVGHSGGGGSCKAHAACLEAQLQRELTTMSDAAAPDEEEAEEDKASAAAVMPSSTTLSLPSAVAAVHYEDFCDSDGAHFRLSFRRLGKSAVSPVFLGLCCATGVLVAVKALNLSGSEKRMTDQRRRRLRRKNILILTEQSVDQIVSEVKVMSALQHECIVGYVSAALHGRRLLLVMEYVCGGSLYTVMNAYRLSVPQARQYLRDVLRGLKYLHSKGILHCDVKPQNVLVGDAGCKLADFGVARSLRLSTCDGGGASSPSPFAHGTPEYMSPESTVGRATDRSDVWSFGIMLAHVITGELPWPAGTPRTSLMVNLARGAISPALRRPMPPEADGAEEVFRCCTRMAPAERPSIAEVLRMPFFSTPPRH